MRIACLGFLSWIFPCGQASSLTHCVRGISAVRRLEVAWERARNTIKPQPPCPETMMDTDPDIKETPILEPPAMVGLGVPGLVDQTHSMDVEPGPSNSQGSGTKDQLVGVLKPAIKVVFRDEPDQEILSKAEKLAGEIIAAGASKRILDDPKGNENWQAMLQAALSMF